MLPRDTDISRGGQELSELHGELGAKIQFTITAASLYFEPVNLAAPPPSAPRSGARLLCRIRALNIKPHHVSFYGLLESTFLFHSIKSRRKEKCHSPLEI
jgi:hypothetical protein